MTLKQLEDVLLEVLNLERFQVFMSFTCLYSSTLTDAFVDVYVCVSVLLFVFFLFFGYLKSERQVCYVSYHKLLCLIDVCLLLQWWFEL